MSLSGLALPIVLQADHWIQYRSNLVASHSLNYQVEGSCVLAHSGAHGWQSNSVPMGTATEASRLRVEHAACCLQGLPLLVM